MVWLGVCFALACGVKPRITTANFPDDLPACTRNLAWQTAKLVAPNLYPGDHDRLLMCVRKRDGTYAWAEFEIRVVR